MLIFKLWNYLRGYVVINLKGISCEKTLNLFRRKNINMWDVEKSEDGVRFKISCEDYQKYGKLLGDRGIEPAGKTGFSFSLGKLKSRKGFAAGLIILMLCIAVMSALIWDIEIIGAENVSPREIKAVLKDNGISAPIASGSVNEKRVAAIIYKNFDEFKFVEAHIQGSKLIVFVKEKRSETIELEDRTPSSIVATKDAVITSVVAKTGRPVVQAGDVVYKGQTLIMGLVKSNIKEEYSTVPSIGSVYGRTYYSFAYKEEKQKYVEVGADNKKSVVYLNLNNNRIKLFGSESPFENTAYREKELKVPVFSRLTGIYLIHGQSYEQKKDLVSVSSETASNRMKIKMYDELLSQVGPDSKIYSTDINITEDDTYYYMNAQIEVTEDIGERVRLYPADIQPQPVEPAN